MAYKIIWSLQARDDLREIVSFIAADHPDAAERIARSAAPAAAPKPALQGAVLSDR